jgi:hypothetical protein
MADMATTKDTRVASVGVIAGRPFVRVYVEGSLVLVSTDATGLAELAAMGVPVHNEGRKAIK